MRTSNGWSHHFYYDRIHSLSVGYVDRTCWTSPFQPETSRRAKVVELGTGLRRGHFPSKCARSKSDLARAHVVGRLRLEEGIDGLIGPPGGGQAGALLGEELHPEGPLAVQPGLPREALDPEGHEVRGEERRRLAVAL